ncbi:AAA family ATPase [Paenibacillus sp. GCM10023252]|uniref:AAA family ATPase n=1 Tax=Paenibacillus sp. GCM10023252 TaxID=3252649 RepID=UPI00361D4FDE
MRKLLFVVGAAGAGKTTVAKEIAKRTKTVLLDMDTLLRPAAQVIMKLSGQDPQDRDSAIYKTLCRDLGYRITMDAALENVELGGDVIVVGPLTKETGEPEWLQQELARIGATTEDVDVKVLIVYLPGEELYKQRIQARGLKQDQWKLAHWKEFSRSLARREVKWDLPAEAIMPYDNSKPLSGERLALLETFLFGVKGSEPA